MCQKQNLSALDTIIPKRFRLSLCRMCRKAIGESSKKPPVKSSLQLIRDAFAAMPAFQPYWGKPAVGK
jgi:hypothetical protein